jgi:hypothetical protein
MKSTEEIITRLRYYDFCHDGDIDDAADRLEELLSALKQIAEMDYTRAATNGMGFDAVKIATRAIGKDGELR